MGLGEFDRLAIEQLVRRFATEVMAGVALEDDRYPFVPWNAAMYRHAASLGLPELGLGEVLGGSEQGTYAFARALEIVAYADAGHAALLLAQTLTRAAIADFDPPPSAAGAALLANDGSERVLGCPLYGDPEELPDSVRVTAGPDGDVLEGELREVACAPVADAILVPAVQGGRAEHEFYLVPRAVAGLRVSEPLVMLGLRSCPVADVRFSQVRVEAAARLGGPAGARQFARTAERYRPVLAAISLGVLRASFDQAFAYARERHQGKRRIVQHHMVQELLARMQSVLDLGGLALERACQLSERADLPAFGSELLSLHESITACAASGTTDGVQLLGGNGYMHDYGQEKRMRDAKQLQAVFGGSAVRRLRIIERKLRGVD